MPFFRIYLVEHVRQLPLVSAFAQLGSAIGREGRGEVEQTPEERVYPL